MIIFLLLLLLVVDDCKADIYGVDVSVAITQTQASCFVSNGVQFAIARAWLCGSSNPDNAAIATYRALKSAGMKHIGFYLYPCVDRSSCQTAQVQVQLMAQFLTRNNLTADSVWLDVESGGTKTVLFFFLV